MNFVVIGADYKDAAFRSGIRSTPAVTVTMRYTHTNLDSRHAAVAKLEGFGDNLVTACTKMQQPKEGLSPNAVISYNVARR